MQKIKLTVFLLLNWPSLVYASSIAPFDYKKIDQLSSYIYIAKVISTTKSVPQGPCSSKKYEAKMEVITSLKGEVKYNEFTLPVCIGYKGYGRDLFVDRTYIFFLQESKGQLQLIYPHGVVGEFQ